VSRFSIRREATLATLVYGVYRLFASWVPTIPALAALLLLPRTGRKLEHAAATRA
jgi:hypothetical protein